MKKRGRKSTKPDKIKTLLANLPRGFIFNGPAENCTEDYIKNDIMSGGNKMNEQDIDRQG